MLSYAVEIGTLDVAEEDEEEEEKESTLSIVCVHGQPKHVLTSINSNRSAPRLALLDDLVTVRPPSASALASSSSSSSSSFSLS